MTKLEMRKIINRYETKLRNDLKTDIKLFGKDDPITNTTRHCWCCMNDLRNELDLGHVLYPDRDSLWCNDVLKRDDD